MATRTRGVTGVAVAVVAILTSTSNAEATHASACTDRTSSPSTVGAGSSGTSAAGADDRPTATVRVDNLAAIPNDYLQFAEGRATAIFTGVGARIIWLDEASVIQRHINPPFTLVVVRSGYAPGRDSRSIDALGRAIPSARRAHVFYDRIEALNVSSNSILSVLGDVMAHELGHLLLPWSGHSLDGIMRRNVTIRWVPAPTFSKSQAVEILCRLRQLR
jgi:hypothetical protein